MYIEFKRKARKFIPAFDNGIELDQSAARIVTVLEEKGFTDIDIGEVLNVLYHGPSRISVDQARIIGKAIQERSE